MKIKCLKYTVFILIAIFWPLAGCAISTDKYVQKSEFITLNTKVDNLALQVDSLAQNRGVSVAKSKAGPNNRLMANDEKSLYREGQALLRNKQYEAAAVIFKRMLSTTPQGGLAPNASYWLGECYYARGLYLEAATEFKRCVASYPKSNKAPDALLKLSYSYDRLEEGHQAMMAVEQLLANYPDSSSANLIKSGRGQF